MDCWLGMPAPNPRRLYVRVAARVVPLHLGHAARLVPGPTGCLSRHRPVAHLRLLLLLLRRLLLPLILMKLFLKRSPGLSEGFHDSRRGRTSSLVGRFARLLASIEPALSALLFKPRLDWCWFWHCSWRRLCCGCGRPGREMLEGMFKTLEVVIELLLQVLKLMIESFGPHFYNLRFLEGFAEEPR